MDNQQNNNQPQGGENGNQGNNGKFPKNQLFIVLIAAFITFAIAGVAVCHRHPFDQPEAEQELADGYHIEYSGMKFGLFFVGEYIGIVTISALMVTLFFGGWQGPLLPPFIWFALKTAFFMMMFILIRASLPRPRYDQVMSFGWKICLPLTLINLLVTAAVILWQAQ